MLVLLLLVAKLAGMNLRRRRGEERETLTWSAGRLDEDDEDEDDGRLDEDEEKEGGGEG